jgi:hypothetical protein
LGVGSKEGVGYVFACSLGKSCGIVLGLSVQPTCVFCCYFNPYFHISPKYISSTWACKYTSYCQASLVVWLLTLPGSALLDDPAATPLGRRKQLSDMVKMSDEEIKNMSPDEIRKMMQKGADLDDKGEPKQKDSSLKIRIELDLEVEVHLTARVQGDITIGLL